MKVEFLIVSDESKFVSDKLAVSGVFDSIHSSNYPARHRKCYVSTKMRFSSGEEGSHSIRIFFLDSKGCSSFESEPFDFVAKTGKTFTHILEITDLIIPSRGVFYFGAYVDNLLVKKTAIEFLGSLNPKEGTQEPSH